MTNEFHGRCEKVRIGMSRVFSLFTVSVVDGLRDFTIELCSLYNMGRGKGRALFMLCRTKTVWEKSLFLDLFFIHVLAKARGKK